MINYTNKMLKQIKRSGKSGFIEIVVILLIAFVIRTFGYGLYRVPTGSMETTMLVGELFFADKFLVLFSNPQHGDIISFNDPLYSYSDNKLIELFQNYVWGPSNWTKRIIGVPGDKIRGVIEDGKPVIYRNDEKLDEHYLNKYPLIGVWKVDPLTLATYASSGGNISSDFSSLKSYDPPRPFNEQPFYAIDRNRIIQDAAGKPLLRYPGTPLRLGRVAQAAKDKNYWNGSDEFYIELGKNQYWAMGDNRLNSHDSRALGPLNGKLIHGKIRYRLLSLDSDESWIIVDLLKHPINFWKQVRCHRCLQSVK